MELALLTTALLSKYDITLVDPKQVLSTSSHALTIESRIGSLDDFNTA